MSRGGPGEGDRDISKHQDAKLSVLQRAGPLTVWVVDGRKIRDRVYVDFTEGGNSKAYPWMPADEVWLDNANFREYRFILLHELHEYNEMKEHGLSYDAAHDKANRVERTARHDPSLTEALISREIARLTPKRARYGEG